MNGALFLKKLAVAALVAAATVASVLHDPVRPADLSLLLPPHAGFALHERNLAGRWTDLVGNPLAASLLRTLGADERAVRRLAQDARASQWIRELVGEEVALGFLPALSADRQAEWVLVSRLGPRHLKWRWLLETGLIQGSQREGSHHGHAIWRVSTGREEAGMGLRCSVMEGLLLASFSPDDLALRQLINRYDVQVHLPVSASPLEGYAPDRLSRGWLRWGPGEPVRFVLSELDASRVGIELEFRSGLPAPAEVAAAGDGVESLLRGMPRPLAAVSLSPGLIAAAGRGGLRWPPLVAHVVAALADAQSVVLLVFDQPYESRWRGLKMPFLLMAVRLPSAGGGVADRVDGLLDGLNARHRLGLIAADAARPGLAGLRIVESTEDNSYARLPPQERLALAGEGEWLLVGSHAGSMARFLADRMVAPASSGGWVASVAGAGEGMGWVDLERGGERLSAMLLLQALARSFRDPGAGSIWVERAQEFKAWTEAFAPLRAGSFYLSFQDDLAVVEVRAGSVEGAEGE